jgi:hypothetical protein
MAAYVIYVIDVENLSAGQLTNIAQAPTNPDTALALAANIISGLQGGTLNGTIQVTCTAVNPAISAPVDTGSSQNSYSKQ